MRKILTFIALASLTLVLSFSFSFLIKQTYISNLKGQKTASNHFSNGLLANYSKRVQGWHTNQAYNFSNNKLTGNNIKKIFSLQRKRENESFAYINLIFLLVIATFAYDIIKKKLITFNTRNDLILTTDSQTVREEVNKQHDNENEPVLDNHIIANKSKKYPRNNDQFLDS